MDSRTTRSRKRKAPDEDELAEDKEDEKTSSDTAKDTENDSPAQNGTPAVAGDELAEIGGVKPKTYMPDGEEREVKSLTRYVHKSSVTSQFKP